MARPRPATTATAARRKGRRRGCGRAVVASVARVVELDDQVGVRADGVLVERAVHQQETAPGARGRGEHPLGRACTPMRSSRWVPLIAMLMSARSRLTSSDRPTLRNAPVAVCSPRPVPEQSQAAPDRNQPAAITTSSSASSPTLASRRKRTTNRYRRDHCSRLAGRRKRILHQTSRVRMPDARTGRWDHRCRGSPHGLTVDIPSVRTGVERGSSTPGSTASWDSSLFPTHAREVPAAASLGRSSRGRIPPRDDEHLVLLCRQAWFCARNWFGLRDSPWCLCGLPHIRAVPATLRPADDRTPTRGHAEPPRPDGPFRRLP